MKYFPILFLALAIAGIGLFLRSRRPRIAHSLLAAACITCAGLIIWQARAFFWSGNDQPPDRYHAAAAYVLAHEVLRDVVHQDGRVVLLFPPESVAGAETLDAIFNTFARVFAPFTQIELVEATVNDSSRNFRSGALSIDSFDQCLRTATGGVAYVSFVGLPNQAERLSTFASSNKPPFYVFAPAETDSLRQSLNRRFIRTAIVPRPDIEKPKGKIIGPPNEIFQTHFVRLTADTP